jgi:hypothetical protein
LLCIIPNKIKIETKEPAVFRKREVDKKTPSGHRKRFAVFWFRKHHSGFTAVICAAVAVVLIRLLVKLAIDNFFKGLLIKLI